MNNLAQLLETEKVSLQELVPSKKNSEELDTLYEKKKCKEDCSASQDKIAHFPVLKKEGTEEKSEGLRAVSKFKCFQRWEGVVLDINEEEETFRARLFDLLGTALEEEAILSISDISQDDEDLFKKGSVFYLSIGYQDDVSGQRTKSCFCRFRRLPIWEKETLLRAEREADEMYANLEWE